MLEGTKEGLKGIEAITKAGKALITFTIGRFPGDEHLTLKASPAPMSI